MAEREQRLTDIFHSAIERQGAERRAFLDGACGNDEELRREVEALIRSHEDAGSIIDSPAYERAADLFNKELIGRRLGQYRLISHIGSGGMGEVYLAEDTRLDRRVAIKVLSSSFTADTTQVGRFQQEARAASALNHPNIITVYDINESDGTQYIATEFIEGHTLRTRLAEGNLELRESLDIAIQVASALSAAHGAGVVHRDVKPENMMLRPDGYVKVLDFGIAKLTEVRRPQLQSEAPTRALVKTGKGVVMGTAHYMSPEQARGQTVDARTDIWSIGVVLYEMVTGRVPFEGDTPSDCIASILKTEPRPLSEIRPHVPVRLEWIMQKALRKDADERYQKAKELLSDLRAVKQEVDAAGSAPSLSRAASSGENSSTPTAATTRTTSSAEYLVSEIKKHKRGVFMVLALLVAAAAGVGFALYNFASALKSTPPAIFQNVTVSRITTSGRALEANISPDGKFIVYLHMGDDGNRSLMVRQTATGETITIVPPTKGNILKQTSFSPDGNFVYYIFSDRTKPEALYKVPSVGGIPTKIADDCGSPVAVSPDGRQLAFVRWTSGSKSSLIAINADGTGERTIASLNATQWFNDEGPSWSPDGKTIANALGIDEKDDLHQFRLAGIDVQNGAIRDLSPKRWINAGRVVWMPDGTGLVLTAIDSTEEVGHQIWRVAYPSGQASRITNDPQAHDASSLAVTADGRTILTVIEQNLSRIEVIPENGDASSPVRLTPAEGNQEGFRGLDVTPDGRIVFSSFEGGQRDIWIMNGDGSGRRRLTSDTFVDSEPVVSPDGRYVVFLSNRPEGDPVLRLWRMNIDGGSALKLLFDRIDFSPEISSDGRWVVYSVWSAAEGTQSIWKIPIDDGQPIRIFDFPSHSPACSPDGKWISGYFQDQQTKNWDYGIMPAEGGRPSRQFDFPDFQYQRIAWTLDSRYLSFIGRPPDPSNIWLQPIDGAAPRKLTDFKTDYIFRHAWSPDGKSLVLVRGRPSFDVVLIKDMQQ